jgi:outer membrane protein assembly factor BamB
MRRLLPLFLLAFAGSAALAGDWSFWRGPEQIGVSRERDLPESFSLTKGKAGNLLWRAPYGGISTPIVQDGQVYLIYKVGDGPTMQERVVALNADTGEKVWEHRFNVFLTGIVDDRVGWTHMVGDPETGNVYSHGTQGFLTCFSKKGEILWQRSLTEEYGRVSGYGGRLVSPIVDGDLVILGMVNANWGEQTVGGTRFAAFEKRKGHVVWWGSAGYRVKDTHYSCPIVANIAGQRLLIGGGGDGGVHAFQVRTGRKVWSYKFGDGAVNCSPVVHGDRVYIGHGEENENETQGRVICLDGSSVEKGTPKLVWEKDGIKVKYASPILHENRLIVCDEVGKMYCLNADNGEIVWDYVYGKNTKGSPLWADGKIYIAEVDSKFHILRPGPDGCDRLHTQPFRSKTIVPVELNGSPAVANGRVYFTTTNECICIGKPAHKEKPDKIPPQPKETLLASDTTPAWLQVVPADVHLNPGESVEFSVRAFDENGGLIPGKVKAEWALEGMRPPVFPIGLTPPKTSGKPAAPPALVGTLSDKNGTTTKLTVAKMPPGQFGTVVAKAYGISGEARVRVAPVLPYAADFSKIPVGRTPGGWVNTMGKFSIVELSGKKVLSKRNDNASPLVARADAYIGLPKLRDYTIQADVMGTKVRDDLPDVGVGANRYQLLLAGNDQEIRLSTWDAQKRIEQKVPNWKWGPGVWYRMKLTVAIKDGKGVIHGKVWPRDQEEPAAWTIEAEDPVPNTAGSPCLYGFATGILSPTEPGTNIYYDNVRVTPNK